MKHKLNENNTEQLLDINFQNQLKLKHNSASNIEQIIIGKIFNKRGSFIDLKSYKSNLKNWINDAKIIKTSDPYENENDVKKLIELVDKYSFAKDWIYDQNKLSLLYAGGKAQDEQIKLFVAKTIYDNAVGDLLYAQQTALQKELSKNPNEYLDHNDLIKKIKLESNGKIVVTENTKLKSLIRFILKEVNKHKK